MEGGGLQVTMGILFLTTTLALIPVLTEAARSPLDTVPVRMVERMGLGGSAAEGEYGIRRCPAEHSSNELQENCHKRVFAYVSNHKLAVQNGGDLTTTMSNQQKTTSSSPTFTAEIQALIAFKEGVTEDSLGALSSWNSNYSSACRWKGVTCDSSSKSIIALELGNLELVGSISPLLGRLQSLQSLDLSGNFFNGEIPVSLQNCSNLSHLDLHGNNFTGKISPQVGDLLNLKYLDLSGNFLLGGTFPASLGNCSRLQFLLLNTTNVEGAIPYTVGQLTRLEIMNVSASALSGRIPGSLGSCSTLTQLIMGNIVGDEQTVGALGLSGELPTEMSNLTRLNVLKIAGSDVGGSLPGWIANLTRLTRLVLDHGSFWGEIPQFLGQFPLEEIDLEWNNLTGAFPTSLTNCSNLTSISVTSNNLGGGVPPDIGSLNKLTILSMSINDFSGKIPSSIANCSSLTILQLGQNPTMEAQNFPSWITSLANLTQLFLADMNLDGPIPADIGKLSNVIQLILWGNSLTGPIPATIGNCSSIQELQVAENYLTGELPLDIWLLSRVQVVSLFSNFLTGTLPASIGNLSQLVDFECQLNHFTGDIPGEMGSLKDVNYVVMAGNRFSGHIPPSLGNASAILQLDLSQNQLIGAIPTSMGNLSALQIFYLYDNRLQGFIPVDLMRCTELIDLRLYGNSLGGNVPEDIGNLPSLQILSLNNNNLSGVVPNSLGRCTNLVNVDLSYNIFYGVLPPMIMANMSTVLNSWNVSHNRLSGSLPQELAQLKVITSLDFAANNFSGSIPSGLGQCQSLISLDLSMNNLSGSIPQTLAQLEHLVYFNVSSDNLKGPIPNGGIFATNNVTAASFSGNNGLCGSILGRACVDLSPSKSPAMSTCRAFHCASIRIAVGCGAAGLLFVVLLLISLFMFRKRKFQIVSNGDASVTTFEGGLKISKDDLITIMSSPENVIGVGAKSTVYKGVLGGDQTVAIKTLSIHPNDSHHDYTQLEADLLSEALMLSKLRHRNVLKFLGCFRNEGIVALISQFMPMASLNDQLYPSPNDGSQTCELNWDVRLHIAVGIAHGLVYLHHQFHEPIIHRDLKPSNIFLDEALDPKLGDFGASMFVNPDRDGEKTASTFCGTVGYIPPEYGTTTTVSTKGDVYSYGVILLELLTRRHPVLAELTASGECWHLVDWVLESFEEDPMAILDSNLIDECTSEENQIQQMKLLMRVGLLCTRKEPQNRPHMSDVLGMLNQIIERGSDQIDLPSVTQLAQESTDWNSTQDPTSSTST